MFNMMMLVMAVVVAVCVVGGIFCLLQTFFSSLAWLFKAASVVLHFYVHVIGARENC